jgi:hypothetical protein
MTLRAGMSSGKTEKDAEVVKKYQYQRGRRWLTCPTRELIHHGQFQDLPGFSHSFEPAAKQTALLELREMLFLLPN